MRTARAKWRTGQARRARPDPLSRGGSRLAAGEQVSAGMLRSQDRMIRGARATNRCAPAARRAAPACMALGSRPLVRLPAGEHTPPPVPPSCRFKKLRPAAAPPTPPGRISPAGRAAPCLHAVTNQTGAADGHCGKIRTHSAEKSARAAHQPRRQDAQAGDEYSPPGSASANAEPGSGVANATPDCSKSNTRSGDQIAD